MKKMEEDEPDYRTPIGKIIKHINTLCKKPQIDEQLSEALDLFNKNLEEQEKYLINGIFRINFTEAALFLQSSAELYGKRIDLLWDQLLEFHTRLIKYDCEHQKEKGAPVDQTVIEKLEERRNRYKRRKKFKLVLQSTEAQKASEFLFDQEKEVNKGARKDDDSDDEAQAWKELESKSYEMRKIPNIVYKQMTQKYRLKNYHILKCQDFEIWDPEDDEFNTKYSRVPGWHHTLHLFEYNDKGLLPDKNNIIARLRLTAYGRIRFLISRKIPLNTPFEQYKEEYMAYRQKFFEEEAKKWQNMPLDTLEDLRKQLQYLVQKEREENGETTNDNAKLGRYGFVKDIDRPSSDDKIEILDSADEESLFELSFSCDKDFMQSDLFVRLEKLSSDIVITKLRQDSGFYDFNSDSDSDCDNESLAATNPDIAGSNEAADKSSGDTNTENLAATNPNLAASDEGADKTSGDTNTENLAATNPNLAASDEGADKASGDRNDGIDGTNKEADNGINAAELFKDSENVANQNTTDNETINNTTSTNELSKDTESLTNEVNENDMPGIAEAIGDNTNNSENLDHLETRSFVSDHDYCLMPAAAVEPNKSCDTSDTDCDPSKRNTTGSSVADAVAKISNETINVAGNNFVMGPPRIIPRIIKIIRKRREPNEQKTEDDGPPRKKRKLSMKQIEKLLQGKVKPVKEQKFEKFFSMNYQPQLGEGEISVVEYESEESDLENIDDEPNLDENQLDDNRSIHSRHDDTSSVFSDHDYCQRAAEGSHNDSGFIDNTNIELLPENEQTPTNTNENSAGDKDGSQSITEVDPSISLEDEIQRLLAALRESSKDQEDDEANESSCLLRGRHEQELREKEREEAQLRVEEWRSSIMPVLRNLKEHDFNIHEYGSQILDNMNINETKPFSNIVQGKPSAEVVRYFISSLQLANTYNIEICGAQQGQLSNDTFNIKLLSKDRYHEHLDDFLAPSEETFREKLERVKAMTSREQVNSDEPIAKKLKLAATSKGKRIATKNKLLVKAKKAKTTSDILPEDIHAVASTSTAGFSQMQSAPQFQIVSGCTSDIGPVQDENNGSPRAYQDKPYSKGKSIIKRPVMGEKSPNNQLLDSDDSVSSHHFYGSSFTSGIDEHMPSTSYQRFSPSPKSDCNQNYSPDVHTLFDRTSPDHRRRDSSEESFRERLASVQEMNPNIQLQSTPHGTAHLKQLSVSLTSRKSISFE